MKKPLAFLLIMIMLVACTACSAPSTTSATDKPSVANNDSTPSPIAENASTAQSGKGDAPAYSLSDSVIIDNGDCAFTVTKIEANGFWGFTLNVLCENKTDKTLMFSWNDVSVNGYMIDPFWSKEVAAGKKANAEISFFDTQLEQCNITSVDEIVFTLSVYDSDNWSADHLVEDEYIIYPTGLDASAVVYPVRAANAGEQVIIDNESCTFIIEGSEIDSIWGYTLNCYLENKTSYPLAFSWNDVSVNGYMVDPFWAKEVAAGKRAFSGISFSDSNFETNGITKVENIEFELRVYNADEWSAPDIYNAVSTYTP